MRGRLPSPGGSSPRLRVLARKAHALRSAKRREAARFRALSWVAAKLLPRYVLTHPDKAWFADEQFFRDFHAVHSEHLTEERKYTLR